MNSQHYFNCKVYYDDTDHFAILYHPNYLKYFERARSEWLLEKGYALDELYKQGIILAIHSLQINYLKPARLNDQLTVISSIQNRQKTNITFNQEMYRGDEIICRAAIRVACLNEQLKLRVFPDIRF